MHLTFCVLRLQIHHYMGTAHLPLSQVYTHSHGASLAECREGVAANFSAMRAALDSLGGVPAVLTGEEFFHERGADERAVVLFTALLCQRLTEAHKEDRAAMVIQRHFRQLRGKQPGSARLHLHRWIAAATVVQRAVKAWLLRRALHSAAREQRRRVAAAVRLQAAWRGHAERASFRRARAAAVQVQACWRGKLARRAFFDATLAVQVVQAASKRHAQLARQVRHARLARDELTRQEAAAIVVQAAWRGHRMRSNLRRQRAAATAIQAAFRGHCLRAAYVRQRDAAIAIQSAVRQRQARQEFLRAKAAAITIQRHARGMLARQEASARLSAILVLQRWVRTHLEGRKQDALDRMKQQMASLAGVLQQFAARTAAARQIQAAWRLHLEGKAQQQLLAQRQQLAREQVFREEAARAVISRWAPAFRDRVWFLQARRAATVLQRWWRHEFVAYTAAATVIQKHTRMFLAVRKFHASKHAAVVIQRAVRGHAVRTCHPQHRRLELIRRRLHAATAEAVRHPQLTLGARTNAALAALAAPHSRSGLPLQALHELVLCTDASPGCCDLLVESGGLRAVLGPVRNVSRDKSQAEQLCCALQVASNVCRHQRHAEDVFSRCAEDGTLLALAELLQHHREQEVSSPGWFHWKMGRCMHATNTSHLGQAVKVRLCHAGGFLGWCLPAGALGCRSRASAGAGSAAGGDEPAGGCGSAAESQAAGGSQVLGQAGGGQGI